MCEEEEEDDEEAEIEGDEGLQQLKVRLGVKRGEMYLELGRRGRGAISAIKTTLPIISLTGYKASRAVVVVLSNVGVGGFVRIYELNALWI